MKFEEAFIALREGKKIRRKKWSQCYTWERDLYVGVKADIPFHPMEYWEEDWEILEESIEKNELKPCPFCATPNPIIREIEHQLTKNTYQIVCCNDKCSGSNFSDFKENCIYKWNNRI